MHKLLIVLFVFVLISEAVAEVESVKVRGQLNVVDNVDDVSSGIAHDYDDSIFDELPSLRIAREYLRRQIAAEHHTEMLTESVNL